MLVREEIGLVYGGGHVGLMPAINYKREEASVQIMLVVLK